MSRYENWLRQRGRDGQPDLTPAQQALGRKVLGELMEGIERDGLFQNKIRREFADGTVVIAQFDGTTPTVEVTKPETPNSLVQGCKPLVGKVSAPAAFGFPQLFFPNWPSTDLYLSRLVPYMGDVYSFNAADKLYKYDPAKNTLTAIPVNTANAPTAQWGDLIAVCVYQAPNGKLRFVFLVYNLTTAYEYEIGTGWLPQITMTPPQNIAAFGVMLPGIDNSRAPLWGQTNQITVAAVVPGYDGHTYEWVVLGYDYVKRAAVAVKAYAYYDGALPDMGAGTYGRVSNVVAATANGDFLVDYYDAATQTYHIPDRLTLYQVHLDSNVVGSGLIGLRFNPVAGAQICAHGYGVGAYAVPRFVSTPGLGHYDYQLLPDYSQIIDLDLMSGEVWHRGSLSFSTTDAELLFTQSQALVCVALADALLIFYPTFERNSNDPTSPNLPHFTATGMNMVRMT